MNAKHVLNKIIAALSADKPVEMTYAKLADGTILESPTFDVGELAEVVSEDGTKSLAPEGEHELILKDSEGNDVRIKILVDAEGKITERENVELADGAKDEEVKKLPEDMASIAGEDIGGEDEDAGDLPVESIPEDMEKKYSDLAYRISEMEKKIAKMEEAKEDIKEDIKEKMEEEELPKLDGAPVDESVSKGQNVKMSKKDKAVSSQSNFLSKLYK
jgi:regulator of replication initiation timing